VQFIYRVAEAHRGVASTKFVISPVAFEVSEKTGKMTMLDGFVLITITEYPVS